MFKLNHGINRTSQGPCPEFQAEPISLLICFGFEHCGCSLKAQSKKMRHGCLQLDFQLKIWPASHNYSYTSTCGHVRWFYLATTFIWWLVMKLIWSKRSASNCSSRLLWPRALRPIYMLVTPLRNSISLYNW